ncbi:MAG: DUF401 family protein, partial [Candidatus Bipolaricaulota bacterium]|nr:DUF401 family protein [Candidatus Bipolaricaulota bacterium]MDW8126416.1 DUF401 family protein [Candidatus Bipolaricaulota bacterium]
SPLSLLPGVFGRVLRDPGVLALIYAAGIIPLIGAALQAGDLLSGLVARIPGGRRTAYVVAPALFGLLPVPGGALFSAPILENLGGGKPEERAAANVWFRHILLSFYPLSSALITGAKLASLDLWTAILWQLPWALFLLIVGALFLLTPFAGPKGGHRGGDTRRFWWGLAVLLLAPFLDLALRRTVALPALEVATALALTASLLLALCVGPGIQGFPRLFLQSQPWRFSLIVVGVFMYLGAFQASGLPKAMAALPFPLAFLVLGLSFLMGLATGRQQAALSVVIPVYLATGKALDGWRFSLIYQACYLGYLLSPLHPCLAVSAEYMRTGLFRTWRRLLLPSAVVLLVVGVVSGLSL